MTTEKCVDCQFGYTGNDCGAAAVSGISEGHGELTSPQRQPRR